MSLRRFVLAMLVVVSSVSSVVVISVVNNDAASASDVHAAATEFIADLRASGYIIDDGQDARNVDGAIEVTTVVGGCRVVLAQSLSVRENQPFNLPARDGRSVQPYLMRWVYVGNDAIPVIGAVTNPTANDVQQYLLRGHNLFTCAATG